MTGHIDLGNDIDVPGSGISHEAFHLCLRVKAAVLRHAILLTDMLRIDREIRIIMRFPHTGRIVLIEAAPCPLFSQ